MIKILGIIVTFSILSLFTYQSFFHKESELSNKLQQENILIEEIPGSKFHSPDGTWWGYNQSKIVRFKSIVFSYFINNIDEDSKTLSMLTVLKKDGENPWEKGATFPTSRPGNILIDSQGTLHAFVFEPLDAKINDSRGALAHYFFPKAFEGNIEDFEKEIVIAGDPDNETVNIRVGATISEDNTMALGFGLTTLNRLYKGHSQHLFFKKPADKNWGHLIAGENLGHDFYYPFVLASGKEFYLLSVQDDFADDGNPNTYDNIYQKIIFFAYQDESWKNQLIADLSSHPLAKNRPRLLEQEDLLKDKDGNIHIIYKEFLNNQQSWKATTHKHVVINKDSKKEEIIKTNGDVNWVRIFEVEEKLYYLTNPFDSFYLGKVGGAKWTKLDIPTDAKGTYPYIAKNFKSDYVDILLLAADSKTYLEGTQKNYYLRIPKNFLPSK